MSCIFICPAHLTSISVHTAVWAQACGLEHFLSSLCTFGHSLPRHFLFMYWCTDCRITILPLLSKIPRREIHSWLRSPAWDETIHGGQWRRVDEDTAVGRFGQEPPPRFSAPTPAYTYHQWKRLGQHHCRRTDEVNRFCDSSKARVGLQQRLSWTMRWCRGRYRIDCDGTGSMLGGHARPGQGVEDREGPLRDQEGRQDGNDLHAPRSSARTQLSTAGECAGDTGASVTQHYETRNSRKAATTRS